jgi:kynurenine formamidase
VMTNSVQRRRWAQRPPGSNWGDFGDDDQIGRMNLLTPEKRVVAAREIREGLTFCLSMPLDYPGGTAMNRARPAPHLRPLIREGRSSMNYPVAPGDAGSTDVLCDDIVDIPTQYSTHWDSLAHIGQHFDADGDGDPEIVYYNGYRAGVDVLDDRHIAAGVAPAPPRAIRLGIENLASTCVQGRGVMVDLLAHFGPARRAVSFDDLDHVFKADGIEIEEGDIVCFHTGYAQAILEMGKSPDPAILATLGAMLDGRDARLLNWISESGVVALAADTNAVEIVRPRDRAAARGATLPLHEHCLFRMGVHLAEYWHLTPLAAWLRANGRTRFFLTAPPLRLPGAAGSPVTPVATV